ncbi:MAG: RHS repeat domain-containing protein, partial [Blastocatellia bacterium]
TRHDLAHNSATGRFESYDSSYIAFDAAQQILYFPNGLKMKYGAYSYDPNTYDHQALPIEIKDRNGNFITINYKTLTFSSSPQRTKVVPDYLIDTAGRRIDFNYQNNRLTSISQNRGGAVFTYAYIDYRPVTIQTNYTNTDPANINGTQVYFPSRITYPTGVNFRFNYTGYGQIDVIEKWVPAIAGQGAERKIASTTFYYYDPSLGTQYFSQRIEWTENGPGGAYQYYYDTANGHELTDPTLRYFRVRLNGMTLTTRVFPAGSDNHTKMDEATYVSDGGVSYLSNPRVSQTKVNGGRTTNYSYLQLDGMWLVQNKDEMQQQTLYRRTTTSYTSYPAQYIFGLPQQVSVYKGSNILLSRVANNYDETGSYTDSNNQSASYFIDASGEGVIQHNASYGGGFTQRGNLTSVVQSSVVNGSVTATRTVKRVSYDTNGNVRAEADGAANRRQIVYTDNYSNKPGGVGQTHVQVYTAADPTGFRAGSQWNYYTGQTIKTFNLTPGSSTEQQVVTTSYDFADRPLQTTRPDGGWVKTAYWENWLATVSSQIVETGKTRYQFALMNGLGAAFKKASDHPDGVAGKYSGHITVFNSVGEVRDSSNVIAIDGAWTPTAEDASTGFLFTNLTRDELSRLKIVTLPDNNTRQYDYTGCGCAGNSETRVTDEMGHYTETRTDDFRRLSEVEEMNPFFGDVYSKAQYLYDELDRLIEIRHSNGDGAKIQTRTFGYDGYGRLQSENTPEGGIVTYTYKANDLVWTVANQRNITVTNSYNTRNLLEQVSYSDGTPAATFGYDAFGARNSMSDGEGSMSYVYNSYRQLESETRTFTGLPGKSFVLGYSYNLADQLKSVNYNYVGGSFNKNVNYAYNSVGALSGVGTNLIGSDPNATTNVLNTVAYRGSGALKSLNYGNGRRLQMGYNANRQQPTSMKVDMASNPSDKILDYAYQYYDANGKNNNRIRKITDAVDASYTTDYTYDDYDRLTIASAPAYSRYYWYDEWGNIKNFSGLTLNHATNASGAPATNRISTAVAGSTTYTHSYDAAGNLTNDGSYAYSYDGANRLKEVGTGGQNTYGYDGNGMRVRVVSGGGLPTFYVRSSVLGQVVLEVNQTLVLRAYVNAAGKVVAQQSRDGQFYWLHTNHLGSGTKLTDSTGAVKSRAEFDPYGQTLLEWSSSGDTYLNTKKYTGYERDEATGLDYANARMYSSARGRFLQADQLGLGASSLNRPQTLNRYTYVDNDPINFVDQTGLYKLAWWVGYPYMLGYYGGMGANGSPSGAPLLEDYSGDVGPGAFEEMITIQPPEDFAPSLTKLLEGDCGKLVSEMINKVGSDTGQKAYSSNILDVYKAVMKQGKIELVPNLKLEGSPVGGYASGGIDQGNAKITLRARQYLANGTWSSPQSFQSMLNSQMQLYTQDVLHELTHLSAGNYTYSDYQLVTALYNLGKISKEVYDKVDPENKDLSASLALDAALDKTCHFNK